MAVHARSLANLGPPFAAGADSRRGNGRSSGATLIEWFNRLDVPGMSRDKLQAIADDEKEQPSKRKAAMTHLRSLTMEYAKNGKPLTWTASSTARTRAQCSGWKSHRKRSATPQR